MKKSLTIALMTAISAATVHAATTRPNVIYILTDDLGWGDIGVFHQNGRGSEPRILTPNLDRMAADGAMMTHSYVGGPVCVASRASLLTGMNQGNAVVRDNQFDRALEDNHTLGSVMRRAGYATAAIGKWGVQGEGAAPDWEASPLKRGFDFYYGAVRHIEGHEHYPKEAPWFAAKGKPNFVHVWENRSEVTAGLDKCYTTDLFTARAKQWIVDQRRADASKPFFLYLAYDTPHAILELPTQAYPAGGGLHGGLQWLGNPGKMISTASGEIDSWVDPAYAESTYDDDGDPATPEKPWPDVYRRYATSVTRIDACVADLLRLLADLGIADDTLVVFSSDNGPSKESHLKEPFSPQFFEGFGPFDGIKRDVWEGGLRVPTIVRWPSHIPAGREVAHASGNWDWLPTFADVASLPAPARSDGVSLLPVLTGEGRQRDHGHLYFEYFEGGKTPAYEQFEPARRGRVRKQMQAVRIGDLMGVRYDVKSQDDDFEIYDVVSDPKETRDLSLEPSQAAMQSKMKALALQSRRPDASAPRPYDAALVPAVKISGPRLQSGLRWRSYRGDFPWVPDLEKLTPTSEGTVVEPELTKAVVQGADGILFSGYIQVPADGEYTFYLRIGGHAILRVHDALVIDADAGYDVGSEKVDRVRLAAGLHPLRLFCAFAKAGGVAPNVTLDWSGPDLTRQPVSKSAGQAMDGSSPVIAGE
jgi:arylsulfatase A-like enzyme